MASSQAFSVNAFRWRVWNNRPRDPKRRPRDKASPNPQMITATNSIAEFHRVQTRIIGFLRKRRVWGAPYKCITTYDTGTKYCTKQWTPHFLHSQHNLIDTRTQCTSFWRHYCEMEWLIKPIFIHSFLWKWILNAKHLSRNVSEEIMKINNTVISFDNSSDVILTSFIIKERSGNSHLLLLVSETNETISF